MTELWEVATSSDMAIFLTATGMWVALVYILFGLAFSKMYLTTDQSVVRTRGSFLFWGFWITGFWLPLLIFFIIWEVIKALFHIPWKIYESVRYTWRDFKRSPKRFFQPYQRRITNWFNEPIGQYARQGRHG